jgi:cation-transporting ATPase 13A1
VYFGSLITLNALTWLCVHWSVSLEALFTATKAKSVREASLVKVEPGPNQGKAEMCKLEHVTVLFSPNARY